MGVDRDVDTNAGIDTGGGVGTGGDIGSDLIDDEDVAADVTTDDTVDDKLSTGLDVVELATPCVDAIGDDKRKTVFDVGVATPEDDDMADVDTVCVLGVIAATPDVECTVGGRSKTGFDVGVAEPVVDDSTAADDADDTVTADGEFEGAEDEKCTAAFDVSAFTPAVDAETDFVVDVVTSIADGIGDGTGKVGFDIVGWAGFAGFPATITAPDVEGFGVAVGVAAFDVEAIPAVEIGVFDATVVAFDVDAIAVVEVGAFDATVAFVDAVIVAFGAGATAAPDVDGIAGTVVGSDVVVDAKANATADAKADADTSAADGFNFIAGFSDGRSAGGEAFDKSSVSAGGFCSDNVRILTPHIGSKCFNFHGSNLALSFSDSAFSFACASGVNSPEIIWRKKKHLQSDLKFEWPSGMVANCILYL